MYIRRPSGILCFLVLCFLAVTCCICVQGHEHDHEGTQASISLSLETSSRIWGSLKKMWNKVVSTFTLEKQRVVPVVVDTNLRYVALGDSYASGVGSGGGGYSPKNGDYDRCCSRNKNGYPGLLARSLDVSSFDYRSCMGAVALGNGNTVMNQMRMARHDAQLVTVTVGGNDMGFVDVITACLAPRLMTKRCINTINHSRKLVKTKVKPNLRKLQFELRRKFKKSAIVFTGYPRPYSWKVKGFCHHPWIVRQKVNQLVDELNAAIRASVDQFVPVQFPGNELCSAGDDEWIIDDLKAAVRQSSSNKVKQCSFRRRFMQRIGAAYHVSSGGQHRYKQAILKWWHNKNKKR